MQNSNIGDVSIPSFSFHCLPASKRIISRTACQKIQVYIAFQKVCSPGFWFKKYRIISKLNPKAGFTLSAQSEMMTTKTG